MYRKEKLISLIKEQAALFIRNEAKSDPLITVTNVSLSPDSSRATISVSVLPTEREEDALSFLKRKRYHIKEYLKDNSRMRSVPFIDVEIDQGEKNRQRIDRITQNAYNPEAEE